MNQERYLHGIKYCDSDFLTMVMIHYIFRNNNGTNAPTLSLQIYILDLNNSFEGSCDQFTSLFAVMLRTVKSGEGNRIFRRLLEW